MGWRAEGHWYTNIVFSTSVWLKQNQWRFVLVKCNDIKHTHDNKDSDPYHAYTVCVEFAIFHYNHTISITY